MDTRHARLALVTILLISGLALTASANDPEYKDFTRESTRSQYFEIAFNRKVIDITRPDPGGERSWRFWIEDREQLADTVSFNGVRVFDSRGLWLDGELLPWEHVYDLRISSGDRFTLISFYKRVGEEGRPQKLRRGSGNGEGRTAGQGRSP